MICTDCRGEKCLNLIHDVSSESQNCSTCGGTGTIVRHGECIKRNEGKVPADCDCQHVMNTMRKY